MGSKNIAGNCIADEPIKAVIGIATFDIPQGLGFPIASIGLNIIPSLGTMAIRECMQDC